MTDHIATCGDCEHLFDTRDDRAFVLNDADKKKYPELHSVCPACNQVSDASKAWAVWNDCQGIFTNAVFNSRAEAMACLAETFTVDQESVVPVRVLVEPEENWWHRAFEERER